MTPLREGELSLAVDLSRSRAKVEGSRYKGLPHGVCHPAKTDTIIVVEMNNSGYRTISNSEIGRGVGVGGTSVINT